MLKAIVGLGLLALAQSYITAQTRARRQRLADASDTQSILNWEDEGGAVAIAAQGGQVVPAPATGTLGSYPSAGQAG